MAAGSPTILQAETSLNAPRGRRDLLELSVGYALIQIVIWTPRPWQRAIYFVAAAFILAAFWSSYPGRRALGLRATNLARSLWLIGAALAAAAAADLAAARFHTLLVPHGVGLFFHRYAGYILFAFVQQGLLQDFFLPRLLRLTTSKGAAVLASAALFSLAHLPNPILTVITFVWGLMACLFFLRYRSLYALALAHAILGVTVAMCVPGPVIRNMRVGLGYLKYPAQHRLNATRPTTPYPQSHG